MFCNLGPALIMSFICASGDSVLLTFQTLAPKKPTGKALRTPSLKHRSLHPEHLGHTALSLSGCCLGCHFVLGPTVCRFVLDRVEQPGILIVIILRESGTFSAAIYMEGAVSEGFFVRLFVFSKGERSSTFAAVICCPECDS